VGSAIIAPSLGGWGWLGLGRNPSLRSSSFLSSSSILIFLPLVLAKHHLIVPISIPKSQTAKCPPIHRRRNRLPLFQAPLFSPRCLQHEPFDLPPPNHPPNPRNGSKQRSVRYDSPQSRPRLSVVHALPLLFYHAVCFPSSSLSPVRPHASFPCPLSPSETPSPSRRG
jgi:hypothetical protein